MNVVVLGSAMLVAPILPKADVNKRVPMAGSRFNPLPGETVVTGPSTRLAKTESAVPDDSQGIVSVH